ncbi:MAG TPA: hypothetical protein PLZ10_12465 [Chitinophagaceae bacterium]|nr:hypothetical protein [Chitinophagaceae bacterium]
MLKRSQFILFLLFFVLLMRANAQSTCDFINDSLFISKIEIRESGRGSAVFFCTSREYQVKDYSNQSVLGFLTDFLKFKNYCPYLPDGYQLELIKCFPGREKIISDSIEMRKGNVYELQRDLSESPNQQNFNLTTNTSVTIKTLRHKGTFLILDKNRYSAGFNTDEYELDMKAFFEKTIYVPVNTINCSIFHH